MNMILRKIAGYLLIPLCIVMLSACGGSSGGDENASDPANGSNWDQMEWDKGSWS